jgi:hypothetical protein
MREQTECLLPAAVSFVTTLLAGAVLLVAFFASEGGRGFGVHQSIPVRNRKGSPSTVYRRRAILLNRRNAFLNRLPPGAPCGSSADAMGSVRCPLPIHVAQWRIWP